MSDLTYLRTSLAKLGGRRDALVAALVQERDRNVAAGDHDLAQVWNALAATTRDFLDTERTTLRAMESDLSPVVRPLTADELADVDWPGEC